MGVAVGAGNRTQSLQLRSSGRELEPAFLSESCFFSSAPSLLGASGSLFIGESKVYGSCSLDPEFGISVSRRQDSSSFGAFGSFSIGGSETTGSCLDERCCILSGAELCPSVEGVDARTRVAWSHGARS